MQSKSFQSINAFGIFCQPVIVQLFICFCINPFIQNIPIFFKFVKWHSIAT